MEGSPLKLRSLATVRHLQEVHEGVIVGSSLGLTEVGGVEEHVHLAAGHNNRLEGRLVLEELVQS
eukprot:2613462-Pyramimonas_sp.AAC.1